MSRNTQPARFDSTPLRVPGAIPLVDPRPRDDRSLSAPDGPPLTAGERAEGAAPPALLAQRAAPAARSARLRLLAVVARRLNPLVRALAGSRRLRLFAVVHHRGRRSGRAYATPVGARPTAGGFVIPLTFGEEADWFQNLQAAGECVIQWNGEEYAVVDPVVVERAGARSAFGPVELVVMRLLGIERFVRVRHAASGVRAPSPQRFVAGAEQ